MAIPYAELDVLLAELVSTVLEILAHDLVGFYVVGSFAVGDADLNSDCDVIVATRHRVPAAQEHALAA